MSYTEIKRCRICDNSDLITIIHLGEQYLGGVFPKDRDHLRSLEKGPLELVKCHGSDSCGLLQLRQSYDPVVMFAENKYGYLSSLNRTMVDHLRNKVLRITSLVRLSEGDCVVDIGSNDATLLKAYPQIGLDLVGIDPGGDRLRQHYPGNIRLIADFFSTAAFRDAVGGRRKAKVVTSVAMFYDLEDPMRFMREVHDILTDDGVWVTEQGYMPTMLANRYYDAICHEHLEYYGLRQIKWMADRIGFRIIDVEMNKVNGGSFTVTLAKGGPFHLSGSPVVDEIIAREPTSLDPYLAFTEGVGRSRRELRDFLARTKSEGKRIYGLGASTKGNTLLQYCGVIEELLPFIGDVNSDKFGYYTPGTQIPIISENEVLAMKPDYLLVLPHHFRNFFADNPKYAGASLVFPLPVLDVLH